MRKKDTMSEQKLKRNDFYEFVGMNCKGEKTFELTYKKVNGEIRKAVGKLHDEEADKLVKGTGYSRKHKMDLWKVFQYFDVNSHAFRSAKLENIIDVKVDDVLYTLED